MTKSEKEIQLKYLKKFSDPNERLGKTCPKCGSDKISFLMYGIGWDEAEQPLVDSREIIPLGCISKDFNNLGCRDCNHTFMSISASDYMLGNFGEEEPSAKKD